MLVKKILIVILLIISLCLSSCCVKDYSDSVHLENIDSNVLNYDDCVIKLVRSTDGKQDKVIKEMDIGGEKVIYKAKDIGISSICPAKGDDIIISLYTFADPPLYSAEIINIKTEKKISQSEYNIPDNGIIDSVYRNITFFFMNEADENQIPEYSWYYFVGNDKPQKNNMKSINFTRKYVYYVNDIGDICRSEYDLKKSKEILTGKNIDSFFIDKQYIIYNEFSYSRTDKLIIYNLSSEKMNSISVPEDYWSLSSAISNENSVFINGMHSIIKVNLLNLSVEKIVEVEDTKSIYSFDLQDDFINYYISMPVSEGSNLVVYQDYKLDLKMLSTTR